MKKTVLFIVFLYGFLSLSAQYTEVINSKRPGLSESPYGVGTKVLQIETGGFYQNAFNSNETFLTKNSLGGNVFLRYSEFLEKLEINADITYQKDKHVFNNVFISNPYTVSGVSRLTIGAKYLIYNSVFKDKSKEIRSWKKRHAFDWKRLVPSVGVYAGWNSNYLSDVYKEDGMSLKGAVLLQNDINERFVILTNLVVDNILLDHIEYSYILTSTLAVNEKWSVFGEHQGVFNKFKDTEYRFGGGFAYLFSDDIQVDISARTSMFNSTFTSYYIGLGGAWRLDHHEKNTKKNGALDGTREPFFKRIFKKKKKGTKPKTRKVKVKKRRKNKKSKGPSFFKKKKNRKKKRRRKDK